MSKILALTLAAVWLACAPSVTSAGDINAKALKQVRERLEELKAPEAIVEAIKEDTGKTFPDRAFVSVRFRLWPVGVVPPEPLKSQNVFMLGKDGKLTHLTSSKDLETLFKANVAVVGLNNERIKGNTGDIVRAWLRLSQEFVQDGFYKFKLDSDSIGVKGESLLVGQLLVVLEQGNKGLLSVSLQVGATGKKIVSVTEENKVVRGIRPRCQATRLLDADPIIRDICEQDLLVMGRSARAYLMEQRARATPELQRAIDRVWQRIVDEDR